MNWRQYQNEFIVLLGLFLMLLAFLYKNTQISSGAQKTASIIQSSNELKEIASLKKIWAHENIEKKVDNLGKLIPPAKSMWKKEKKKLSASYKGLSAAELNNLINKVLNLATQVKLLEIKKVGSLYNVEYQCKW